MQRDLRLVVPIPLCLDHREDSVPGFFSSRRNWDSPILSPAGECAPPPLWGRGGGGVPIPSRGHTLWYSRRPMQIQFVLESCLNYWAMKLIGRWKGTRGGGMVLGWWWIHRYVTNGAGGSLYSVLCTTLIVSLHKHPTPLNWEVQVRHRNRTYLCHSLVWVYSITVRL